MYGNSLRLVGLRISQEVRKLKEPSVLEYGRSHNYVLQALKKTGYQFNGYYMVDKTVCNKARMEPKEEYIKLREENCSKKFDFIVLYNTIHYYSKDTFLNRMSLLEEFLNIDGFIIIVDLFYKKNDLFSSEILLDWLTHGGTKFLTVESLVNELINNDYHLSRSIEIPKISTMMLIIQKRTKRDSLL